MFRTFEQSDATAAPDGLVFVTVKSEALGHRADLTLWAPPVEHGHEALPIVLLLHGVYGSHWAWALKGGAHHTARRLMEGGMIPPMILCMPSDGLWGDGSGYVPHATRDYERWILDEAPAAARQAFGRGTGVAPVFVAGLSMGGFAALRLAGKYPDRIRAASAHSAITAAARLDDLIIEGRTGWSTAEVDTSVIAALRAAPSALPPIRFDCGRDDPWIEDNRALHRDLEASGIAHRYEESDGGHDWNYWARTVEESLRFFGAIADGTRDRNRLTEKAS